MTSPGLGPRNSPPRANILRHHASRGGVSPSRANNDQHFVPDMNITEQLSLQTFQKYASCQCCRHLFPCSQDDAIASSLDGRWVRSGKNIHIDNLCINEHQFCYLYPISQGLIGW